MTVTNAKVQPWAGLRGKPLVQGPNLEARQVRPLVLDAGDVEDAEQDEQHAGVHEIPNALHLAPHQLAL